MTATSLTPNPTFNEYSFRVDPLDGTFIWNIEGRQLDFGGVAKGYVLDQLAPALREQGVNAALLDAGGSSLLAWDNSSNDLPWMVSLAAADDTTSERLLTSNFDKTIAPARPLVTLGNSALSYSATRESGSSSGQTIDPRHGTPIAEQRACVVLADSAAWAEVLSTAALCMGEAVAGKYIEDSSPVPCQLIWLGHHAVL